MDKRGREFRFLVPYFLSGSGKLDLLHNCLSYNNTSARLSTQMIHTCRELAKTSPEVIRDGVAISVIDTHHALAARKLMVG